MLLRVVAELLGDDGVAEEEGEVGEHVLTGGRDGAGGGKLFRAVDVGHVDFRGLVVRLEGFVLLGSEVWQLGVPGTRSLLLLL